MKANVLKSSVALIGLCLFLSFGLSSFVAKKEEIKYLWIAKRYNSEKVYVISESIEMPDNLKVKDLKLRFKSAAYRNFGKDPNGDIEIESIAPKANKEIVEKSREKQMQKMKEDGWKVFTLHRFNY